MCVCTCEIGYVHVCTIITFVAHLACIYICVCIHIRFHARFHEIFAIEWRKQFRHDLPSAGQEIEERPDTRVKRDGVAMGSRMAGLFSLSYSLTFLFISFLLSPPFLSLRFLLTSYRTYIYIYIRWNAAGCRLPSGWKGQGRGAFEGG